LIDWAASNSNNCRQSRRWEKWIEEAIVQAIVW
jgi:hypothetical protein